MDDRTENLDRNHIAKARANPAMMARIVRRIVFMILGFYR